MFIQKLRLQNCRCFTDRTFLFDKKFVLIEGANGSGKTTILEALHYGCFLKSFRTNRLRDLFTFEQQNLFIQVDFEERTGDSNQVHVGMVLEEGVPKRLVRFNKRVVTSYRDLINCYRIVSLAENDLQLVQGAPEERRYFLNQLCTLFKPECINTLKKYRQILEHRNNILARTQEHSLASSQELRIWSKQLWEETQVIQRERAANLSMLETEINKLLTEHFATLDLTITFKYLAKHGQQAPKNQQTFNEVFEAFWEGYKEKHLHDEWRWKRSLFGAHLDDFAITFHDKQAKQFASRGQQKLVLFLTKIALAQRLEDQQKQVALLLDDFLTDFDEKRLSDCLSLLSKLSCQVFITCPLRSLITKYYGEDSNLLQIVQL